jgi:hypothetical protein
MRRVVKSNGRVAVIVFSALEKNPYHGIVYDTVRRIGNIPLPATGEPWMYALGNQTALESVYSRAGFLNVSVQTVPIVRRFSSASDAIRRSRSGAGDVRQLISRLSESSREVAWAEIEQQFKQFEGPNGLEIPGERRNGDIVNFHSADPDRRLWCSLEEKLNVPFSRAHLHRKSVGSGHLYQGTYKSFPKPAPRSRILLSIGPHISSQI